MDAVCPFEQVDPEKPESLALAITFLTVNSVLCILILAANAFTLSALFHQRWCRKETLCPRFKVSSLFVMNLAVADFLIGCAILFFLTTHFVCPIAEYLAHSKFLCVMKTAVLIFTASISVTTIAAISVDRYVAVIHSLRYPEFMTRRRALGIIGCTWVVGSMGASSLFFWNRFEPGRPCREDVIPQKHMTLIGGPLHCAVFAVILVAHLYIRNEINAMRERRRKCNASIFGIELQNNSVKSVRAVVLVVGCYLVCWIPFLTTLGMKLLGMRSHALDVAFEVLFTVANSNALLNPFIYSWKNASVRTALHQFTSKLVRVMKRGADDNLSGGPGIKRRSPQSSSSGLTVTSVHSAVSARVSSGELVDKYTALKDAV